MTTPGAPRHVLLADGVQELLDNLDKIITTCESCDDGEVVSGGKVAHLDDAG